MAKINFRDFIIPKDVRYHTNSVPLSIFAALWTYAGMLPLAILDAYLWTFQHVYFGIHRIPKIDRKKYFVIDRYKLPKLTLTQKLNCVYCGYANAVAAYSVAVAQQMEKYSCAVKHEHRAEGQNQKDYYDRKKFE